MYIIQTFIKCFFCFLFGSRKESNFFQNLYFINNSWMRKTKSLILFSQVYNTYPSKQILMFINVKNPVLQFSFVDLLTLYI